MATKQYGVNVHSMIPFDDKFQIDEMAFRKHLRDRKSTRLNSSHT